ncbi:MAG: PhzF family phenazine biosynthesis protein, partial [Myxococcota bacterium]
LAAKLGHSETAFVMPAAGARRTVRYFTPKTEVPFCGHATIATGVTLGRTQGPGEYIFDTPAGSVVVDVEQAQGQWRAAFRSVTTGHTKIGDDVLAPALKALRWFKGDLDARWPPAIAWAGARHLVLAVRARATLDALDYDYEGLKDVLMAHDAVTAQLVWREDDRVVHARDPAPAVGISEDPATGSAAAALGGYLRDAQLVSTPASLTIRQGEVMGRPSILHVEIPRSGGIRISGSAVTLSDGGAKPGVDLI